MPEDVSAKQVLDVIRRAGGDLLAAASVFDRFRGDQVGEGKVSIGFALEFRAPDRTLTDEEVNERRAAIAEALASELGASSVADGSSSARAAMAARWPRTCCGAIRSSSFGT